MSFPTISTNFMFYLCILAGIQRVVIPTFPHLLMHRGYPLWHYVNVERLIVCTIEFARRYALCLLLLAFYHLKDNQNFKFEFTFDFFVVAKIKISYQFIFLKYFHLVIHNSQKDIFHPVI